MTDDDVRHVVELAKLVVTARQRDGRPRRDMATALSAYGACIACNLPRQDRLYYAELLMSLAKLVLEEEAVA